MRNSLGSEEAVLPFMLHRVNDGMARQVSREDLGDLVILCMQLSLLQAHWQNRGHENSLFPFLLAAVEG